MFRRLLYSNISEDNRFDSDRFPKGFNLTREMCSGKKISFIKKEDDTYQIVSPSFFIFCFWISFLRGALVLRM